MEAICSLTGWMRLSTQCMMWLEQSNASWAKRNERVAGAT